MMLLAFFGQTQAHSGTASNMGYIWVHDSEVSILSQVSLALFVVPELIDRMQGVEKHQRIGVLVEISEQTV